jgi:hypothetical protein
VPEPLSAVVFALLSFNYDRVEIMRDIAQVAKVIMSKGVTDPINSLALARIIKVSGAGAYDDIFDSVAGKALDPKAINAKLDEWNAVWGYILENSEVFLYNEEFEASVLGMYSKLSRSFVSE